MLQTAGSTGPVSQQLGGCQVACPEAGVRPAGSSARRKRSRTLWREPRGARSPHGDCALAPALGLVSLRVVRRAQPGAERMPQRERRVPALAAEAQLGAWGRGRAIGDTLTAEDDEPNARTQQQCRTCERAKTRRQETCYTGESPEIAPVADNGCGGSSCFSPWLGGGREHRAADRGAGNADADARP